MPPGLTFFFFPYHPLAGRSDWPCLPILRSSTWYCWVISPAQTAGLGTLGSLGVAHSMTPALGPGQGEGGGQVSGTFSAGRHSASGGDVWALGHGQLGRGQLLGNRLLEPPEGKDRGGPLSAQTWKSSELFHPLGSPGQHCVRSQGRAEVTQTPVRCSGGGVRSPSSYSWGCVLPALRHSVLILPALGTPNSPSTKIHQWSCVPSHMLTTVQERRRPRHCLQGSCSLVGKTAISVSEPAGILPLWMPLAFCLYNSNKHKVQENGFLLEGVWEDGGENGK